MALKLIAVKEGEQVKFEPTENRNRKLILYCKIPNGTKEMYEQLAREEYELKGFSIDKITWR